MPKFVKGHPRYGGRKPGGTKAELDLKRAILAAFEAVDGAKYLEGVAKKDPKTFCTLLGRVLPLQITGDKDNPLSHEFAVTLQFGQATAAPLVETKKEEAMSVVDFPKLLHMPEK